MGNLVLLMGVTPLRIMYPIPFLKFLETLLWYHLLVNLSICFGIFASLFSSVSLDSTNRVSFRIFCFFLPLALLLDSTRL